jgi:uncharacterized GH25 family protein
VIGDGARSHRHHAIACGLGVFLGLVARADAHEFWIEPSQSRSDAGGHIGVYLCSGDGYDGSSLPRDSARLVEFTAHGPDGTRPVIGRDGSDPAGFVRFERAGPHVLTYVSRRAISLMTPAQFERHLEEKGLDAPLARHRAQPRDDRPVRESYSRYAKLLLQVGDAGVLADRRLGLPFEIVATQARTPVATGRWSFQLFYLDRPLAGALVVATRLGTSDAPIEARADDDGRLSFPITAAGYWRIASVHMTRPPTGVDTEWDSLWASLVFEWRGAGVAGPAPREEGAPHCQNRRLASSAQVSR